jgi:predicted phosphodiesterase
MRIGYMSDIHLRFNKDYEAFIATQAPSVDVQIIAGDVIDGIFDLDLLRSLFRRFPMPLVFVPGNHEFFQKEIHPFETERRLKSLEREFPNLHVLISESWQVPEGPRIVGATMWYRATPEMSWRHGTWADFRFVQDIIAYTNERFAVDNDLLINVKEGDVVVTHMLPSWKCVDPRFEGAKTNELFVRNVEPIIRDNKPSVWIHGHTHSPVDTWVGETHILCNPRGTIRAAGPENPGFDQNRSFEWPVRLDVPGGPNAVIK